MADGAALEMPCARKGTAGSNPALSVKKPAIELAFFVPSAFRRKPALHSGKENGKALTMKSMKSMKG